MSEKRCINKCIYDKELQGCSSCHRTLDEIKQAGLNMKPMLETEFKLRLDHLKCQFVSDKSQLCKEYVFSNAIAKVGDVVRNSHSSIRVIKLKYSTGDTPQCYYFGLCLTKKGLPRKDRETTTIPQSQVIEVISKGEDRKCRLRF